MIIIRGRRIGGGGGGGGGIIRSEELVSLANSGQGNKKVEGETVDVDGVVCRDPKKVFQVECVEFALQDLKL